ncbi:MAG TPA: hypothetical protein VGQ38_14865 [Gaiellaceae bacterium]|jgi:hypothetical protein|nr:hypothetical protein [Gaiellaceae bacterium]
MPGWLFAVIVFVFAVVAFIVIRRAQRGAFVDRLPIADGEHVILEERGLKVAHRFRKRAVSGGWRTTYRVRSVLTDRRIVLATGGPEGKHRFTILMILDYTNPALAVSDTGYPAYLEKFAMSNGYPTYGFSKDDAAVDDDGALHVHVPFPEKGDSWGEPPEVRLFTPQAARYLDAIT